MHPRGALLLLLTVGLVPVGSSSDVLHPQVCDPAIGCLSADVCVEGMLCPANRCEPVATCEAYVFADPTTCVENATIDGSTCVTTAAAIAIVQRDLALPVLGQAGTNAVALEAAVTQGEVRGFNLPNAWIAPAVTLQATVAGRPLGESSAGLYRSDILVPGSARFPQLTGGEHVYSQTTFEVRTGGGPVGTHEVVVGLVQLDHAPDGCFVRTSLPVLPDPTCPRPSTILP